MHACRCAARWAPPGTSPMRRCSSPPTRPVSSPAWRFSWTAAARSISADSEPLTFRNRSLGYACKEEVMKGLMAWKIIVISFVLLPGFPPVASAQKLVVGYSGITAIQAPVWVMKDAGYFKQEGLDA